MNVRRYDMGREVRDGVPLERAGPAHAAALPRGETAHQRPAGMPRAMVPTSVSGRLWIALQGRGEAMSIDDAAQAVGVRRTQLRANIEPWIERGAFVRADQAGVELIWLGGGR